MHNEIKLGSVVLATAGRDEGYLFLVVQVLDNEYVMIANGDNRTLLKPKRKKIKHLKSQNIIIDSIAEKLALGKKVYDSEIYSALKKAKNE